MLNLEAQDTRSGLELLAKNPIQLYMSQVMSQVKSRLGCAQRNGHWRRIDVHTSGRGSRDAWGATDRLIDLLHTTGGRR